MCFLQVKMLIARVMCMLCVYFDLNSFAENNKMKLENG